LGKKSCLDELPLAQRRSPSWEVEPLRWIAVRYAQNAFLRIDAAAEKGDRKPWDAPVAELLGKH
jgi:hypothetical protein